MYGVTTYICITPILTFKYFLFYFIKQEYLYYWSYLDLYYGAATGRRSMDYGIANNIQNQYKSIMRRGGYQVVNVFNTIGGVSNETGCRRTGRTVVRTAVRHC